MLMWLRFCRSWRVLFCLEWGYDGRVARWDTGHSGRFLVLSRVITLVNSYFARLQICIRCFLGIIAGA